jgi:hypothetical protein
MSSPVRTGLSIAGLILAGVSLLISLLTASFLAPVQPPPPSGNPETGSFIAGATLVFRVVLLVLFGGVDLVCVVLAVVFGAVGATRSQSSWQRVSFWVCLPFVVLAFVAAVAVGVWGVMVAAQPRH